MSTSSRALAGPMGAARPSIPLSKPHRDRRRFQAVADRWPSWTEELRVCTPGPESVPIEDAHFWRDSSDRDHYAITARPKAR